MHVASAAWEDPDDPWTHPENSQRQLLRLNLLRRPPPRALSNRSLLHTGRPLPLLLLRGHGRLPARDPFRRRIMRTKCSMRSEFLGVARQLVHFIKFLVPAHEVQAHTYGFPVDPLDGNDSSVEPTTGLPAARVDLRGHLAFTPSTRLVPIRRGRGWFIFRV